MNYNKKTEVGSRKTEENSAIQKKCTTDPTVRGEVMRMEMTDVRRLKKIGLTYNEKSVSYKTTDPPVVGQVVSDFFPSTKSIGVTLKP